MDKTKDDLIAPFNSLFGILKPFEGAIREQIALSTPFSGFGNSMGVPSPAPLTFQLPFRDSGGESS